MTCLRDHLRHQRVLLVSKAQTTVTIIAPPEDAPTYVLLARVKQGTGLHSPITIHSERMLCTTSDLHNLTLRETLDKN